MSYEILVKFYPALFVIAVLVGVIYLICKTSRSNETQTTGAHKTAEIDKLMGNQNSGTPTSYVVDALKDEKIVYRGTEER